MREAPFWWRKLYSQAQHNARRRGCAFTLSEQDFEELARRSNGRCAVTGIRFSMESVPGSRRKPFSPSVDRIDCSHGYVHGNVRIVCLLVNLALSDFGLDAFLRVVRSINADRARDLERTAAAFKPIGPWATAADYLESRGKPRSAGSRFAWCVRRKTTELGLSWKKRRGSTLYPTEALDRAFEEFLAASEPARRS